MTNSALGNADSSDASGIADGSAVATSSGATVALRPCEAVLKGYSQGDYEMKGVRYCRHQKRPEGILVRSKEGACEGGRKGITVGWTEGISVGGMVDNLHRGPHRVCPT